VRAIKAREAVAIAERKQRLISIFGNVAEVAAERMEELAPQASLRDAGTTAGIATDKLLALLGDSQTQVQSYTHVHISMNELAARFNAWTRSLKANAEAKGDAPSPAPAAPAALTDTGQASA